MSRFAFVFLFFLPVAANAAVSGSATLTSDYVFRGITQSDESPAIQAGVTFDSHGFYADLWGSNVDFNDGDEAQLELDVSGGYKWQMGWLNADAGVIYYAYPGANRALDYDYTELKLSLSGDAGPVTLIGSGYYSPDYFGGSGDALYLNAAASLPLGKSGFALSAAAGHQWIEDEAAFGAPDYTDWNAGVSYAWDKTVFAISYINTNLSRGDCPDGCEARVTGSVTYNFQ